MAGDLATAHRVCREHCYEHGACFTVTPSKFIYTGGEEDGFAVGLVNYPRFPSTVADLHQRADELAQKLLRACNQRTCLLVGVGATSGITTWLVAEPPGAVPPPKKQRRLCSCRCACTGINLEDDCPHRGTAP